MTLLELADKIRELRETALFGSQTVDEVEDGGLAPKAQEELVSALCFLELARAAANKAALHQAMALAESPHRR